MGGGKQIRWSQRSLAGVAGVAVGVVLTAGLVPALVDRDPTPVTASGAEQFDSVTDEAADGVGGGPKAATAGSDQAAANDGRTSSGGASSARPAQNEGDGDATSSETGGNAAEEIIVGVLLIDLGGVSRVGFAAPGLDPKEQRRWYEVFFKELNDAGGVGGRTVRAVYATYDPTSPDSQRAACLALTEDAHALAVLENTGGYRGPNVLCFTNEHRTPFLSTFHRHNEEEMRQSGELLLGYGMSARRNLANLVHELEALKRLEGKTIGVLESSRAGDESTNDAGLIATLEELGYRVAKRFATSEDLNTAASQIPLAVREMRAAGVDAVFLNANVLVSTQFVNAAEGQLYRPAYFTHEWYGLGSDFGAGQMPPAFEGALAVVAERDGEYNTPGRTEPAVDRNCREAVKQATGEDYPLDSDQNALVVQTCGVVRLFGAGARGAGPELTPSALSAAIQRLGPVDPPRVGPGFFRPGRLDAASHVRIKTWAGDCRCWKIARDFAPARV